jgi:hypothetical protein
MRRDGRLTAALRVVTVTGCTWVKPTAEGEKVALHVERMVLGRWSILSCQVSAAAALSRSARGRGRASGARLHP